MLQQFINQRPLSSSLILFDSLLFIMLCFCQRSRCCLKNSSSSLLISRIPVSYPCIYFSLLFFQLINCILLLILATSQFLDLLASSLLLVPIESVISEYPYLGLSITSCLASSTILFGLKWLSLPLLLLLRLFAIILFLPYP